MVLVEFFPRLLSRHCWGWRVRAGRAPSRGGGQEASAPSLAGLPITACDPGEATAKAKAETTLSLTMESQKSHPPLLSVLITQTSVVPGWLGGVVGFGGPFQGSRSHNETKIRSPRL